MIISFSGTSGSGKSTIITEIKKNEFFKGKKIIVKKEDSFRTIKLLKIIFGEDIFLKYKEEKFFKRKYNNFFSRIFSALSYIFYPLVVYVEFFIDYIWYELLFKKNLLIADRFIYDYEVTFKNVLGIDNRVIRWLYAHPPKLYLSFLIDISLTTALLRNKNNIAGKITADELFHKNVLKDYLSIAKKHSVIVIDNNDNFKSAIQQINTYIINKEKLLKAGKIAICGLDGSGKTTVANMLVKYANSLNIKSTVIHFYHVNLLFKFLKSVGYYSDESQDILYKKSRERSTRERLKRTSFIKAALRFFDSYIQYLFSTVINTNRLIIFDRYFYDYLVSFEYLNIKPRAFFSKLIPEIPNKFLLESFPATSFKRKPESVEEFFSENHLIYQRMAKEQNIKIINIEKKSPETILQEIIDNIN